MIELRALEYEDMGIILDWRRDTPESWRTPEPYTTRAQELWWENVINADPPVGYYWGIYDENIFVGQGELSGLSWKNNYRVAEIGLVVDPACTERGIGTRAIGQLLERGFIEKGLSKIWGEVYACNKARGFWQKMVIKYNGDWCSKEEPCAKWYKGQWHGSNRFWFLKENWGHNENQK